MTPAPDEDLFQDAPDARPAGDAEKLAALEREVRMRQRDYPRLVGQGKMTAAEAGRQIAVIAAIADDYRARRDGRA